MIEAGRFIDAACARGIAFWTGVPCSFLTPLMNAVISNPGSRYVGAASEGEAVAIAAGAWLAGKDAAVIFQNSGLGNAINPLTSLNFPARIPALLITTWRGQPGMADEPQHELMGRITQSLLDTVCVTNAPFPTEEAHIPRILDQALAEMRDTGLPFGLVLAKGSVGDSRLNQPAPAARRAAAPVGAWSGAVPPKRIAVLERLCEALPDSAFIATTGYTGRELYLLGDAPRNFYCVGSMGGASAIGLGAALNSNRNIAVLDGDGAALMKLGNLATIGAEAPANLTHIVLDNGMHESTGGQRTASAGVDFAAVASACGYRYSARADTLDTAEAALSEAQASDGPGFLHIRVSPSGIKDLPRPHIGPDEAARRFREHLA